MEGTFTKEFKQKIILIVFIVVLVISAYYFFSPYENCIREYTRQYPDIKWGPWCVKQSPW